MLSVIIPTLQKNKKILNKLIETLDSDKAVKEIILIDNSLDGFCHNSSKLKVIIPEENLYVNESWNIGVEHAVCDKIALLNDDILISKDFCTKVSKKIDKKMGIIGFNSQDYMEFKTNTNEEIPASSENLTLEPIKYMDQYFGAAMFFYKEAYTKIPKDIKIVYGDCWLIHFCKKQKRTNYRINGQTIYHIGSLSSAEKKLINICKNDSKLFKKYTLSFIDRLYSKEEHRDCYKIRMLGLTIKFNK